jgi:hypothetical protein
MTIRCQAKITKHNNSEGTMKEWDVVFEPTCGVRKIIKEDGKRYECRKTPAFKNPQYKQHYYNYAEYICKEHLQNVIRYGKKNKSDYFE